MDSDYLTVGEMPSHNHDLAYTYRPDGSAGHWGISYINVASVKETTSTAGGDAPHNNVQPYKAVYAWYRTV